MLSNIQYWMEANPYAPGLFLLAVGLVIGLFGLKLYRAVLFLAGFCLGIAVGYELGIHIGRPDLGLLAGIVLGAVLGGITFATHYISIILLGLFGGAAIGYNINPNNLIVIVISAGLGVVLALLLHKYIILIGSSFLGGLFVSNGIRLIVSSRFDIYQSEPLGTILLWSAAVISAALFLGFQWRNYRDRIEEQDEKWREKRNRN